MHFETKRYELSTGPAELCKWSMQYHREARQKKTRALLPSDGDFLGLYFCLSDKIDYVIRNLQSGTIKGLHYGLFYAPRRTCELTLRPGYYASFSVRLLPSFLKGFADNFPLLYHFMAKVDQSIPASLTKEPLLATAPMINAIYDVINNKYTLRGNLRNMYLTSKLTDILMVSLLHIHTQCAEALDALDTESARKAKSALQAGDESFFYQ